MALQDNFNAIYNKKEQQKAEKLKIKIHDENIEQQLLEDLQALQLDFITENEKSLLLLPKTKNNLINEVIKNNIIKQKNVTKIFLIITIISFPFLSYYNKRLN